MPRLSVTCTLVAYYQVVIAPIRSAVPRNPPQGLGTEFPIAIGSDTIDSSRRSEIFELHEGFVGILKHAQIPYRLIFEESAWHLIHALNFDINPDN